MTCYLAEKGLPVVVPTEPICGTTSPITLAGNVLTHVAETLGGIALVQCVNKGAPGICGSVGSITNLQTMDHVGGPIERAMINAAVAQMAQHFEIPALLDRRHHRRQGSRHPGRLRERHVQPAGGHVGRQLHPRYRRADGVGPDRFLREAGDGQRDPGHVPAGACAASKSTTRRWRRDLMIEKGPGQDFMMEEHTMRHMRDEFFMPAAGQPAERENACRAR